MQKIRTTGIQWLIALALFTVMFVPQSVFAQPTNATPINTASSTPNLLPACATSTGSCGMCDVFSFFGNISELILTFISGIVVLMLVVGGLFWVSSAGNSERIDRGKQIMLAAFVGSVFIFAGFVLVNFTMLLLLGSTGKGGNYEIVTPFGNTPWNQFCEDVQPAGSPNYLPINCTSANEGAACDNGTTSNQCAKGAGCVCKRGPAATGYPAYLKTTDGYYCGTVDSYDFCLSAANDGKACTGCSAPGGCKCQSLKCLSALCTDPKNVGKQCADASCGAAGCVCQTDGTCKNSSATACVGAQDGQSCVSANCTDMSRCVCSGSICKDECTGKAVRELNGAFQSAVCVTDPLTGCVNQGGQVTGAYDCASPSQQCCLKP